MPSQVSHPRRAHRAAAVALVALSLAAVPGRSAVRAEADLRRFTPGASSVLLDPAVPPIVTPNGKFFFVLVSDRLLTTADASDGAYVSSLDLGVEFSAAVAAEPRSPMSISENGAVLALPGAGVVRFFAVGMEGRLEPISQYVTPTAAGVPVWLSPDGEMAVLASGPGGVVATVRTRNGNKIDSLRLSVDETPIQTTYSSRSATIAIVTSHNVLLFRHEANGELKATGEYRRDDPGADAFGASAAFGRRGRVLFTIEQGGTALVGLNIRNAKETARGLPDPRDRFAPPIAVSPDAFTIAVVAVNPQTGQPISLYFFEGKGRGLKKSRPRVLELEQGLGALERLVFDPTGTLLIATFPESNRLVLIDPAEQRVLDTTEAVGSPGGIAFGPGGRSLLLAGSPTAEPLLPAGPGAVTILGVGPRGFSDAGPARFTAMPGILFGSGDHAFSFAGKSHAVVSSGAADALFTFNIDSLREIARFDLGPSTGLIALAPDNHTLVASGGGGLMVIRVEDTGALVPVGAATPGAVPDDLTPSVAFHPGLAVAYVTAANRVWRVDLVTGASDPFALVGEGSRLSNPAVNARAGHLYALADGETLVRCALDGAGTPSVINTLALDAAVDVRAPRVAYDAEGERMWVPDGEVIRQYDLSFGAETGASEARPIGDLLVLVAPGLLAAVPDGQGPVVFFDVAGARPVFAGEVAPPAAPFAPLPGGTPAVDPGTRTVYLPSPAARSIVGAALPDGAGSVIDGDSVTAHLSIVPSARRLAYADIARYPGSAVVAKMN